MFKKHLKDFLSLLFPNTCMHCNVTLVKGEELICLRCFADMPVTNYHLAKPNPVMVHFSAIDKVADAFSYLKYEKKGMATMLLHPLKYTGHTYVGIKLGEWFAGHLYKQMIKASIDMIIPVPLHKTKQRKRGYNQTDLIAIGMSNVLILPVKKNLLLRVKNVSTQTRKDKVERWQNAESLYAIPHPEKFKGKRVLLIDDVVTTGATIGAAAELIADTEVEAIFIACIATGKK